MYVYIYMHIYIYIYIYVYIYTHTHTHIEQRCCMLALSAMHHKHAPVAIRRTAWRVGRAFIRGGVKKKRNMRVIPTPGGTRRLPRAVPCSAFVAPGMLNTCRSW